VALRDHGGARLRRAARGREGALAAAGVAAVCAAAAVVGTEPAVTHLWSSFLASGAPGNGEAAPGDHLQSAYRLWLAGHQLERGHAPWLDPYSFRPEAEPVANPVWWPFGLLAWPLFAGLGVVHAWNVFVLLSFVAAGACAYGWLRELALPRAAALVGALAFELAPYRLAQSRGHLLGPTALLLPLALLGFERALRTGRQRWWWLSRAALVSIPLSGQVHLALGAIPFYAAYAVCRTRAWRPLAETGLGVAAAALAGVLFRLTVIEGSIDERGRSLAQVRVYSADARDLVSRGVGRHGIESFVFLGWLTPALALVGLALLLRMRRYGAAIALGLGTAVPILLALGTTTPIYTALWHALPPLRYPRVPERMMPVANLALAALVAVALTGLLRLLARQRAVAAGAAVAAALLVALDLHVRLFHPTAADPASAAYAAVRTLPPGRMLELPVFLPDIHYGSVYEGYTIQALRRRPVAYSTTAPRSADQIARALQPLSCGDWTSGAGDWLRRLRVTAITLHRGLYLRNPLVPDVAWLAWRSLAAHGWRPVATDGAVTAFARGGQAGGGAPPLAPPFAPPPAGGAIFCDGWYAADRVGRQMAESHASLWLHGPGTVRLFVRSPRSLPVRVSVDGRPAARVRVLRLRELRLELGAGWRLVTFDSPRLPLIGRNRRPRGMRIVAYALPAAAGGQAS